MFKSIVGHILVVSVFVLLVDSATATDNFNEENSLQYSAEINILKEGDVHRLTLSETIQAKLYDVNGRDVYVVDSLGKVMPSYNEIHKGLSVNQMDANFALFPLPNKVADQSNKNIKLLYEEGKVALTLSGDSLGSENLGGENLGEGDNNDGVVGGEALTNKKRINRAYLIDTHMESKVKKVIPNDYSLKKLEFEWQEGFDGMASFQLETSSDLHNWRSIGQEGTVASLKDSDNSVHQNSYTLGNSRTNRYLRLHWLSDLHPLLLAVHGTLEKSVKSNIRFWTKLDLTEIKGKEIDNNRYAINFPSAFQTDAIRITALGNNKLFSGALKKRNSVQADFKKLSLFEHYFVDTVEPKKHFEMYVKPRVSSDYLIEFDFPKNAKVDKDFTIEVSRFPIEIYFLDAGQAPYQLAFSRVQMASEIDTRSGLVKKYLNEIEPNLAQDSVSINDASIKEYSINITQAINWAAWLMWFVLFAGVVLMLGMARKFYLELNSRA